MFRVFHYLSLLFQAHHQPRDHAHALALFPDQDQDQDQGLDLALDQPRAPVRSLVQDLLIVVMHHQGINLYHTSYLMVTP